jgi:hypothetical protein
MDTKQSEPSARARILETIVLTVGGTQCGVFAG